MGAWGGQVSRETWRESQLFVAPGTILRREPRHRGRQNPVCAGRAGGRSAANDWFRESFEDNGVPGEQRSGDGTATQIIPSKLPSGSPTTLVLAGRRHRCVPIAYTAPPQRSRDSGTGMFHVKHTLTVLASPSSQQRQLPTRRPGLVETRGDRRHRSPAPAARARSDMFHVKRLIWLDRCRDSLAPRRDPTGLRRRRPVIGLAIGRIVHVIPARSRGS
jgi:hypothetical protein